MNRLIGETWGRRQGGAVLLLFALCPPLSGQPDVVASAALLRTVDQHYNHLSSLQARYSEHYTGMGMDRTESGELLLKKPGRMRWEYDTPAGKVFVLDGKNAWFYTPGDAQAQRIPAKQLDDLRSPLRFLLGHTELAKELTNATVRALGNSFVIAGTPKGMEQRLRLLSLQVTRLGTIEEMRFEEVDGSATEFIFTKMQENVSVPDADFKFAAPAGVSIIQGMPPL